MSDTIYHYCGVDAMKSIIETRTVWLTHALYLNDYTEYLYFSRRLRELLMSHRNPTAGLDEDEEQVLAVATKRLEHPRCQHYCFCCSSDGDVLSQWRAYAADGAGFTLGFDPDAFDCSLAGEFRAVIYEEEQARRSAQTVLDHVLKSFQVARAEGLPSPRDFAVAEAEKFVALAAMSYKQSGFAEEKEIRYVYYNEWFEGPDQDHARQYRSIGGRLVPYYVANFNPQSLRSMGFGPRNDYDLNLQAAEMLLQSSGYSADQIRFYRSDATYR